MTYYRTATTREGGTHVISHKITNKMEAIKYAAATSMPLDDLSLAIYAYDEDNHPHMLVPSLEEITAALESDPTFADLFHIDIDRVANDIHQLILQTLWISDKLPEPPTRGERLGTNFFTNTTLLTQAPTPGYYLLFSNQGTHTIPATILGPYNTPDELLNATARFVSNLSDGQLRRGYASFMRADPGGKTAISDLVGNDLATIANWAAFAYFKEFHRPGTSIDPPIPPNILALLHNVLSVQEPTQPARPLITSIIFDVWREIVDVFGPTDPLPTTRYQSVLPRSIGGKPEDIICPQCYKRLTVDAPPGIKQTTRYMLEDVAIQNFSKNGCCDDCSEFPANLGRKLTRVSIKTYSRTTASDGAVYEGEE